MISIIKINPLKIVSKKKSINYTVFLTCLLQILQFSRKTALILISVMFNFNNLLWGFYWVFHNYFFIKIEWDMKPFILLYILLHFFYFMQWGLTLLFIKWSEYFVVFWQAFSWNRNELIFKYEPRINKLFSCFINDLIRFYWLSFYCQLSVMIN